MEIKALI